MTQDCKNVALKLPKISLKLPTISLSKAYFGQFKGYILCSGKCWRVFCFRGWKLPQGLYNRSNRCPLISPDIPAIPCLKQKKKVPCIKFLPRTSQGRGQGYPDVWVDDGPGISSCPFVRKILLVSVKFLSAILWGRKWLRQFYGRLEKMRPFCRKTHVHKILRFRGGGILGFWGGGGKCRFYFYGRADFSDKNFIFRLFLRPKLRGQILYTPAPPPLKRPF